MQLVEPPLAKMTMLDDRDRLLMESLRELARFRAALVRIVAIEDKMYGPDWEEIEEAREIAREALKCAK
jgi:hypothetical protein